jgi:hypothetical protein
MPKVPLQPYKRPEPAQDMIRATMSAPPEASEGEEEKAPVAPPAAAAPVLSARQEGGVTRSKSQERATTVTSIRVDVEDWKEFRMQALKEGTDASALVREAMRLFLAGKTR